MNRFAFSLWLGASVIVGMVVIDSAHAQMRSQKSFAAQGSYKGGAQKAGGMCGKGQMPTPFNGGGVPLMKMNMPCSPGGNLQTSMNQNNRFQTPMIQEGKSQPPLNQNVRLQPPMNQNVRFQPPMNQIGKVPAPVVPGFGLKNPIGPQAALHMQMMMNLQQQLQEMRRQGPGMPIPILQGEMGKQNPLVQPVVPFNQPLPPAAPILDGVNGREAQVNAPRDPILLPPVDAIAKKPIPADGK